MPNFESKTAQLEASLASEMILRKTLEGIQTAFYHAAQQVVQGEMRSQVFTALMDHISISLPKTQMCLIACDSEGVHWRVEACTDLFKSFITPSGMMLNIPSELVHRQLDTEPSPSMEKINTSDWLTWMSTLNEFDISETYLLPILSLEAQTSGFAVLMSPTPLNESEHCLAKAALLNLSRVVTLSNMGEQYHRQLLRSTQEDSQTGLLKEQTFLTSFSMMMKDAKRHFQRLAVIVVKAHQGSVSWKANNIATDEMIALANIIGETVRDNDLLARFNQHEFVIGLRIRNFEDAEIVMQKILQEIEQHNDAFADQTRIAVGCSYYPENSSVEQLIEAAQHAVKQNGANNGYILEFHGRYCKSSNDFYDF